MKKIVALVLSLVLALSLAAVAFAAVPIWDNGTQIAYDIFDATSNRKMNTTATDDVMNFTFHAAKAPTYNADGTVKEAGNIAYYTPVAADTYAAYTDTATFDDEQIVIAAGAMYVMVDSYNSDVAFAVKAADATVAEHKQTTPNALYFMVPVTAVKYSYTGTAFTAFSDKCGDYAKPANWTTESKYYTYTADGVKVVAGTKAVADTGVNLLVDGKLVTAGDAVNATKHVWGKATYDKDGTLLTMTCTKCGTVATAVKSAYLVPAGSVSEPINGGAYYLYYNATGTAAGVESAKTFDAGIAMYVGMSLMAVTGSAVVIGKKKEF